MGLRGRFLLASRLFFLICFFFGCTITPGGWCLGGCFGIRSERLRLTCFSRFSGGERTQFCPVFSFFTLFLYILS